MTDYRMMDAMEAARTPDVDATANLAASIIAGIDWFIVDQLTNDDRDAALAELRHAGLARTAEFFAGVRESDT